jgi:hypothetical protein
MTSARELPKKSLRVNSNVFDIRMLPFARSLSRDFKLSHVMRHLSQSVKQSGTRLDRRTGVKETAFARASAPDICWSCVLDRLQHCEMEHASAQLNRTQNEEEFVRRRLNDVIYVYELCQPQKVLWFSHLYSLLCTAIFCS